MNLRRKTAVSEVQGVGPELERRSEGRQLLLC
jgi:hypothetical protein